jgi:hypothetical protein
MDQIKQRFVDTKEGFEDQVLHMDHWIYWPRLEASLYL